MAPVIEPRRAASGARPAGRAILVVIAMLSCTVACEDGGDEYIELTEEQKRRSAQTVVERSRVTLGTIESIVPCEILGDLPIPNDDSGNDYFGWRRLKLFTQSVERSWGPETVEGTAFFFMGVTAGQSEGSNRRPEVGERGFAGVHILESPDVTYSCGVAPEDARIYAESVTTWPATDDAVDEWSEYLDDATPGAALWREPVSGKACMECMVDDPENCTTVPGRGDPACPNEANE